MWEVEHPRAGVWVSPWVVTTAAAGAARKGARLGASQKAGEAAEAGSTAGEGGGGHGVDKDAQYAPFLNPAPRQLYPVPLEFVSVAHFATLIGNNLLAEFWHLIQEGPRGPAIKAMPASDGKLHLVNDGGVGGEEASLIQHLLLINRQLHLVVGQSGGEKDPATGEKTAVILTLKPKLAGFQGQIRSFGSVGSYIAELAALMELAGRGEAAASPVLRAVMQPQLDVLGHWHPPPLPEEDFTLVGHLVKKRQQRAQPTENAGERGEEGAKETETVAPRRKAPEANASQKAAVCALRFALEKIQGPPGTGKSTTIFHIINQRVPPGARVLVTCSRNVAIESIVRKLEACDAEILVVGAPGRIGTSARRHLLDTKTESHPRVRAVAAASLGGFASPAALEAAAEVRGDLMQKCQLILCTIASTARLLREWEEHVQAPLQVHTVIVDECGCTPESSTAMLLNLRPHNLVLLGDHKQLPPCSLVPPQVLKGTGHDRSMLERCVLGSGQVHRLTEQYRMHPHICAAVSRQFYQSRLATAEITSQERFAFAEAAGEPDAMVWAQVSGEEQVPEDGKSYVNAAEVAAVVAAAHRLRERHGSAATIAALTFYKGQYVALLEAMPAALGVECLTVDACQGSEFDYVLISPVRANNRRAIGFVSDPRRINVAVSRARRQCVILGDERTMAGRAGTDWACIRQSCKREEYGASGCRWYHAPPALGFMNMMQHKRLIAKEPVVSEGKKEEETKGTNVGAAAFVPAAILAATAPTPVMSKKKAKAAKAAAKAANKAAAKAEAKAAAMTGGNPSWPETPFGAAGVMGFPGVNVAPPPLPSSVGPMVPRKLLMAMSGAAPPLPPQQPPPPPPTPQQQQQQQQQPAMAAMPPVPGMPVIPGLPGVPPLQGGMMPGGMMPVPPLLPNGSPVRLPQQLFSGGGSDSPPPMPPQNMQYAQHVQHHYQHHHQHGFHQPPMPSQNMAQNGNHAGQMERVVSAFQPRGTHVGHPMAMGISGSDWVPGITPDMLRGMFPGATAAVDAAVRRFGSDERGLNRARVFLLEGGEVGAGRREGGLTERGGAPLDDDEEEQWEPPSQRLGSMLNLREFDILHKADSFDASSELPPGWSEEAAGVKGIEENDGVIAGLFGGRMVGGGNLMNGGTAINAFRGGVNGELTGGAGGMVGWGLNPQGAPSATGAGGFMAPAQSANTGCTPDVAHQALGNAQRHAERVSAPQLNNGGVMSAPPPPLPDGAFGGGVGAPPHGSGPLPHFSFGGGTGGNGEGLGRGGAQNSQIPKPRNTGLPAPRQFTAGR